MGTVVNLGVSQNFPETFAKQAQADSAVQDPSRAPFDIVPHATNALPAVTQSIYVGGGGDVTLRAVDNNADTLFKAVPAGTTINVRASHVRVAGTTASFLVGFA